MAKLFLILGFIAIANASALYSQISPLQDDLTSCAGRCNVSGIIPGAPCQCNNPCVSFGDCCSDYEALCGATGGPITNAELEALSEELFGLEGPNNAARYITVDLQGKTTSGSTNDVAPLPLLTVDPAAYQVDTVAKLVALHDNYAAQVCTAEVFTSQQTTEMDAFIDAVFATPIMQRAQAFLVQKGLPNGRDHFVQIWFDQYSRCSGTLGSSGIEHILLGEINKGVSGFHNWAFFGKGEDNSDVNYRGWMDFVDFGEKGSVIEHNFQWLGQNKPISSMWVGTSPELELALYTVCWNARPNSKCPISLNGKPIKIQTYDLTYNGRKYVASAYPDLSD